MLNCGHCFAPKLRSRLEGLISEANDRQTSLEESLLSLGEFEEAYDELWTWLSDALRQLEDAEPITGDPDAVYTQLSRHKVKNYVCFNLNVPVHAIYAFCMTFV